MAEQVTTPTKAVSVYQSVNESIFNYNVFIFEYNSYIYSHIYVYILISYFCYADINFDLLIDVDE